MDLRDLKAHHDRILKMAETAGLVDPGLSSWLSSWRPHGIVETADTRHNHRCHHCSKVWRHDPPANGVAGHGRRGYIDEHDCPNCGQRPIYTICQPWMLALPHDQWVGCERAIRTWGYIVGVLRFARGK